jgi:hypothetical protein
MKIKGRYYRVFLLYSIVLLLLNGAVYSQGTDSRKTFVNKGKLGVGILLNPLMTNISNEENSASSSISTEKRNSLNFGIDFAYFFSGISGISLGAEYNSYSTRLKLDTYTVKYPSIDSENEVYEMQINGTSIIENQKLSFLNIPINIIFRIPVGEKFGFFLKGGISLDIPIAKTFNGEGTFTYDGYYSSYPILLQDLPDYGFPSNLTTSTSGSLEIKSVNTLYCASCGAYCYLNKALQLVIGVQFNKSMENISAYTPDPDFRLTSVANELNSFMAGSSNVRLQAFGLSIGFRYFFR